jgi:hypothetical protein
MQTLQAIDKQTGEGVEVKIETDCTITHEGKSFEAGGAFVSPTHVTAYMSADMRTVTDWHGNKLGDARIVSKWRRPRNYVSSHMYQVEVTIEGRRYTGRTAGGSMIYNGKAKR